MCSVGVLEGYWGQPLGQISHVPKQPSWFYTLRVAKPGVEFFSKK